VPQARISHTQLIIHGLLVSMDAWHTRELGFDSLLRHFFKNSTHHLALPGHPHSTSTQSGPSIEKLVFLRWRWRIMDVSLRWTIRGGKTWGGQTMGGENNHESIFLFCLVILTFESKVLVPIWQYHHFQIFL